MGVLAHQFWIAEVNYLSIEGVHSVASSLSVTIDALASHNIHNVADLFETPVRREGPFTN